MKNPELARKLQPTFTLITIAGIIGLIYCGYKAFCFDYGYLDMTPMIYGIYALMIGLVVIPIAEINWKIEEELKSINNGGERS